MARETKAQRVERERVERDARQAERVASYPARLMTAFERVNNQYTLDLKVENGLFLVYNPNAPRQEEYLLSYSYSESADSVLYDLEFELDQMEAAQAEARRKAEVRENARRKAQEMFTAEERELLGL